MPLPPRLVLEVVTPDHAVVREEVDEVQLPGVAGYLGILPGHTPLLTDLKPGPVRVIKQGGTEEVFYISGGFLEVQPSMVKVLADTAVRAGDLDEAAAIEARKAAEKALSEKGTEFDYGSAAARLAEAAAQLRTIEEMRKKFGGRIR